MVELRRSMGGRGKKTSPPFFSHEFIIQNHGDIMSCVLMVVVVGLLFQVVSPIKLHLYYFNYEYLLIFQH